MFAYKLWRSALIVWVMISALLAGAFFYIPFANLLELWFEDFRIAIFTQATPQNEDIIIVTITEDIVQKFPYRSPIDREFIGNLLKDLQAKKVRAIGVDILFDQATEPDKDAFLQDVLSKASIPIILADASLESGLNKAQLDFLQGFSLNSPKGMVHLVKSQSDGVVRWLYSRLEKRRGFANQIAYHLDYEPLEQNPRIVWAISNKQDQHPFKVYPATSIKHLPAHWLDNKIVLIGTNLLLEDRHEVPLSLLTTGHERNMPGVEIHAHSLAQIMDQRFVLEWSVAMKLVAFILSGVVGLCLVMMSISTFALIGWAIGLGLIWWIGSFLVYYNHQILMPLVLPTISYMMNILAGLFVKSSDERMRRQFITSAFAKYVPPAIVQDMIDNPQNLTLSGERRELSYIFTDIADFTKISEQYAPEKITQLLNVYFDGIGSIILKHHGTVSDFIGDAVFAIFNAPLMRENHHHHALACAQDIRVFAHELMSHPLAKEINLGVTRIGVHSGIALIGNLGSKEHFKYSPIGDSVNTASRIEGLNKVFSTDICVSQEVVLKAQLSHHYIPIGRFLMQGKTEPMLIYTYIEGKEMPIWGASYQEAFFKIEQKNQDALKMMMALPKHIQDKRYVQFFIDRMRHGEFNTTIQMESK